MVNFSSGWGRSVSPEVAPCCCSKSGVEGLTRSLALKLPPGKAAVPLKPGNIDTDLLQSPFGGKSANFPGPDAWAETAVPFLLKLGPKDNGKALTAPPEQ